MPGSRVQQGHDLTRVPHSSAAASQGFRYVVSSAAQINFEVAGLHEVLVVRDLVCRRALIKRARCRHGSASQFVGLGWDV